MKETTTEQRATSRIDYWREQIAQQERSELPVKQFCETHGITEQTFLSLAEAPAETAVRAICVGGDNAGRARMGWRCQSGVDIPQRRAPTHRPSC
ncbi:MAG: IS66 family insertion sequence element accessory protein TnpA [Bryobacteraceae bacterium]